MPVLFLKNQRLCRLASSALQNMFGHCGLTSRYICVHKDLFSKILKKIFFRRTMKCLGQSCGWLWESGGRKALLATTDLPVGDVFPSQTRVFRVWPTFAFRQFLTVSPPFPQKSQHFHFTFCQKFFLRGDWLILWEKYFLGGDNVLGAMMLWTQESPARHGPGSVCMRSSVCRPWDAHLCDLTKISFFLLLIIIDLTEEQNLAYNTKGVGWKLSQAWCVEHLDVFAFNVAF